MSKGTTSGPLTRFSPASSPGLASATSSGKPPGTRSSARPSARSSASADPRPRVRRPSNGRGRRTPPVFASATRTPNTDPSPGLIWPHASPGAVAHVDGQRIRPLKRPVTLSPRSPWPRFFRDTRTVRAAEDLLRRRVAHAGPGCPRRAQERHGRAREEPASVDEDPIRRIARTVRVDRRNQEPQCLRSDARTPGEHIHSPHPCIPHIPDAVTHCAAAGAPLAFGASTRVVAQVKGPNVTATARTTAADALRHCALFSRVDDGTLAVCIDSLRTRRYRRNETIFHQGDPGDSLYIIESGAVKIVLPSPEGEDEAIIATLGPGDFFGELALLDGAERSATAIAHEATTALVLRRHAFGQLIDTVPALRHELLAGQSAGQVQEVELL